MAKVAVVNPVECTLCELCMKSCPKKCIKMGKEHAEIDKRRCIGCGICIDECPNSAISLIGKESKK